MESVNQESENLTTEAAQASFGQLVDGVITSQASNTAVHLSASDLSIQINDLQADQARTTQTPPVLLQNASGTQDVSLTVEELAMAYQPQLAPPPALQTAPAPADDRAIIEPGTQTAQPPRLENSPQEEMEEEGQIDQSTLTKSFITLLGQAVVSLVTILFSNGNHPLSPNGKILRDFAAGSNIVGYISFFTRLLICGHRRGLYARIVAVVGYAGVGFGFLAIMGLLLPDRVNLWITFGACAACLPAMAMAIWG